MGKQIPEALSFEREQRIRDWHVRALYLALYEVTNTYWGVNDAHAGDGGQPPSMIRNARKALREAAGIVS